MDNDPGPYRFRASICSVFAYEDSSCVYFIQEEGSGPIKIGMSTCRALETRIISLQIGNPRPLALKGVVPLQGRRNVGVKEEARLHEHFASCRIRGEWFRPCPSLESLLVEFAYEKYGGMLRKFLREALVETTVLDTARKMSA